LKQRQRGATRHRQDEPQHQSDEAQNHVRGNSGQGYLDDEAHQVPERHVRINHLDFVVRAGEHSIQEFLLLQLELVNVCQGLRLRFK
jgi:hypothetical protein